MKSGTQVVLMLNEFVFIVACVLQICSGVLAANTSDVTAAERPALTPPEHRAGAIRVFVESIAKNFSTNAHARAVLRKYF